MVKINPHYQQLRKEYIFPVIEQKLAQLQERCPNALILNLGIGDIALPLAPSITAAICKAVEEMGRQETKKGYGPSEGYAFLKEAIAKHDYKGLDIAPEEVFISDGINSDAVNIQELFALDSTVGIPNPTYPAYLDANIMAGRHAHIVMLASGEAEGFLPRPPQQHCDLVYLCSPNNPTGVAMTRSQLAEWVTYAQRENALLLYDNAYAAFITSPDVPHSIYELPGAKEVALEMRSFSKTAGFTGLRCAYMIVPKTVKAALNHETLALHPLWMRRQSTKSNGVAYPIQKGAEAVFSAQGQQETKAQISSYLEQARILKEGLQKRGYTCFGGVDSPYIWWKTPQNLSSWEFFDRLLEECHLISVPGRGFGSLGEGYVRLSAFTTKETAEVALSRIEKMKV